MSRWDLMLTSDPTPPRPDAATAEFVDAFFQSAESALRDEAVTFPFSEIADRGTRRRLASELFLSSDGLGPGWMAMFRTSISDRAATLPLDAVTDHPWLQLEHDDEETWTPTCVSRYMCVLDDTLRGLRNRASKTFPFLVLLAIVEAHSTGPVSRVRAAWAVLDGIDRGERLLPLLCKFLRVGKSAVRLSAMLLGFPWQLQKTWNITKRLLRVMAAMPQDMRPSWVTDHSPSVLPLLYLSVVAGAAGVPVGRLFPLSLGVCAALSAMRHVSKKERSIRLRHEIETLRAEGALGWMSRHQRDIAAPWPIMETIVTPSGWHAIPIKGHKALVVEGNEMGHCVVSYSKQLRKDQAIVWSLRSPALGERVTLVVEDVIHRSSTLDHAFQDLKEQGYVPSLWLTVAGPGNSDPSFAAYRAVLEILEVFTPHELRIGVRGGVRRGTDLQLPCMIQPPESTQQ